MRFTKKIPSVKQHLIFWLLTAACTFADLWTKSAVFEHLESIENSHLSILGNFVSFIIRENAGAAFSIAHGQTVFLVIVSIIALIAIIAVFELGLLKSKFMTIVAAMFTAGICGNLYDRLFNNGMVRDFIDVNLYINNYHWPTFNVADSLMCIALAMYIIKGIIDDKRAKDEKHSEI